VGPQIRTPKRALTTRHGGSNRDILTGRHFDPFLEPAIPGVFHLDHMGTRRNPNANGSFGHRGGSTADEYGGPWWDGTNDERSNGIAGRVSSGGGSHHDREWRARGPSDPK